MQEPTAVQHAADVLRFVRGADSRSSRSDVLSTAIARSWRRCVEDYALDPALRQPAPVVDSHVLHDLRERHAVLVQIASADMAWL
jgi:transcriptional regulator of acetoin/glycerol metabolism